MFWLVVEICVDVEFLSCFLVSWRFCVDGLLDVLFEPIQSFVEFFRVLTVFRNVSILLIDFDILLFILLLILRNFRFFDFLKRIKYILIVENRVWKLIFINFFFQKIFNSFLYAFNLKQLVDIRSLLRVYNENLLYNVWYIWAECARDFLIFANHYFPRYLHDGISDEWRLKGTHLV